MALPLAWRVESLFFTNFLTALEDTSVHITLGLIYKTESSLPSKCQQFHFCDFLTHSESLTSTLTVRNDECPMICGSN